MSFSQSVHHTVKSQIKELLKIHWGSSPSGKTLWSLAIIKSEQHLTLNCASRAVFHCPFCTILNYNPFRIFQIVSRVYREGHNVWKPLGLSEVRRLQCDSIFSARASFLCAALLSELYWLRCSSWAWILLRKERAGREGSMYIQHNAFLLASGAAMQHLELLTIKDETNPICILLSGRVFH